jgi:hypothetical protein
VDGRKLTHGRDRARSFERGDRTTLFVSEATVKMHVTRILARLDRRDRAKVVVFAYECGLVQPGETEVAERTS